MRIPSPRSNRRARIEIIPLIDVIFFLLATFVVVSTSMIKNQGIPVHLPVAATGAPQERKEYATITVTENGDIFFNKQSVGVEELPVRLKAFKLGNPDAKVFINGDEKADFGKAVSVLDEVRKIGMTKVAIETKIPSKHEP